MKKKFISPIHPSIPTSLPPSIFTHTTMNCESTGQTWATLRRQCVEHVLAEIARAQRTTDRNQAMDILANAKAYQIQHLTATLNAFAIMQQQGRYAILEPGPVIPPVRVAQNEPPFVFLGFPAMAALPAQKRGTGTEKKKDERAAKTVYRHVRFPAASRPTDNGVSTKAYIFFPEEMRRVQMGVFNVRTEPPFEQELTLCFYKSGEAYHQHQTVLHDFEGFSIHPSPYGVLTAEGLAPHHFSLFVDVLRQLLIDVYSDM